ncbi:MAG TPA: hypothetical protein DEF84_10425, partial [Leclercia adecarboxylata]|nr:hypothetical protein [Leclercia adecarboxylata]
MKRSTNDQSVGVCDRRGFPSERCWITLSATSNQGKLCRRLMTVRVAINGFGRIGRNVVRALYESGR